MNAVENDIRVLVGKELSAANERFPQFHSQHEGYAVIKEWHTLCDWIESLPYSELITGCGRYKRE